MTLTLRTNNKQQQLKTSVLDEVKRWMDLKREEKCTIFEISSLKKNLISLEISKSIYIHTYIRNPNPKYENGFYHLWHLALGNVRKTNDENL